METKNVLYAAVGAPVVAARKVGVKVKDLRSKIANEASGYSHAAEKAINSWAAEGEKVVGQISDGKVVDEITAKVDLDQAKVQVTKLRDQLEDMLATWRSSFRPERPEAQAVAETPAPKTAVKKPAPKKPATKKPAAKTSAAKTSGSTTAKKSPAKTASVKTEKAS